MKKHLIIVLCILLLLAIIIEAGIVDALVAFLLIGVLPGTDYALSPSTMLLIGSFALALLVLQFIALPLAHHLHINRLARHYLKRKERFPKRRFGQI